MSSCCCMNCWCGSLNRSMFLVILDGNWKRYCRSEEEFVEDSAGVLWFLSVLMDELVPLMSLFHLHINLRKWSSRLLLTNYWKTRMGFSPLGSRLVHIFSLLPLFFLANALLLLPLGNSFVGMCLCMLVSPILVLAIVARIETRWEKHNNYYKAIQEPKLWTLTHGYYVLILRLLRVKSVSLPYPCLI